MDPERIIRSVVRGWVVWCLVVLALAGTIGCCSLVVLLSWLATLTQ